MKDILTYLIKAIVENPDDVVVEEQEDDETLLLTISVNQTDMGKVIGKSGRVIKALRTIMKIPATKQGKRVRINLADQEQPAQAE